MVDNALSKPRKSLPLKEGADLLARYLRPQTRMALVVAALLLTDIGLDLINPQILRYFIDEAMAGSAIGRLITAAAVFTGITLVGQVVNVAVTYASGRVAWTATNALRVDLTRHCLSLDMSFHNNRTPGEMIARVDTDASQLGGFFSTFIIEILGNVLLLMGILGLLFREDWRAGLALAGFAAIALFVISTMRRVSRVDGGGPFTRLRGTSTAFWKNGCLAVRICAPAQVVPDTHDGVAEEQPYPESTEGGRRVSVLRRQEGAPVLLG